MTGFIKKVFCRKGKTASGPSDTNRGTSDQSYKYVVAGAGPAGVTAAETLRQNDPDGSILLLGGEPEAPYSRMAIPYLLVGSIEEEGTHIRHQDGHYENLKIDCRQGRVSQVNPASKTLLLEGGNRIGYDKLCLATGAHPIKPPIPGLDQEGILHCWTLEDARKIIELAHEGADVVLMGAGFIGCIILEALALRKVNLTVIEMGDRMVPRMLDPVAGNMLKSWCANKGVTVHTATKITKVEPHPGDAEDTLLVDLDNGKQIPAHLLVVAAGVKSNLGYLDGAGLEIDQGILVDERLQTSDENIYAIGDVAQAPAFEGEDKVVHAIQTTATDHGRIAALNMSGIAARYNGSLAMNVLDTLGLISVSFGEWNGVEGGDNAVSVDRENNRYIRLEFSGGRLVGAQSVGRTDQVGVLRGLIEGRVPLGDWKEKLKKNPHLVMDAYLACAQR